MADLHSQAAKSKGYYVLRTHALVRVVNNATHEALFKYERFQCTVNILASLSDNAELCQAACESAIISGYSHQFVSHLKAQPEAKKKLGGQQWAVEIKDLIYKLDRSQLWD